MNDLSGKLRKENSYILVAMNKVAIIAAMHGDEVYGIDLYDAFIKQHPELSSSVRLVIGNEAAHQKNIRFIDKDMNRQYASTSKSHEQDEIIRVNNEIRGFETDYIIDIHTTRRDSGIFFISDTPNKKRQHIYNMLDIDICIMEDEVIKTSLIGSYDNAVSLEYSLRSINQKTTDKFIAALANLVHGQSTRMNNSRFYYAKRLISKNEWQEQQNLKNYDKTPAGIALMVPKDLSEMDAEYFGFWCEAKICQP